MRSAVPSRRLTRLGAIPLLFLTLLGLVVGGLSAPALAAPGDTITLSGTVSRTANGVTAGEPGVTVEAFLTTNLTAAVTSTTSSEGGAWSFPATPELEEQAAGSGYKIKFSGPGVDTVWFANGGAVADAASATTLNASSSTVNATVPLTPVTISGVVRNDADQGIQGITVALQSRVLGQGGSTSYSAVTTTPSPVTTGNDGSYSFTVRPGSYVMSFAGSGFGTSYVDSVNSGEAVLVRNRDEAELQVVARNTPRTINAELAPVTQVTGRVTDRSGAPLGGVIVRPISYAPASPAADLGSWAPLGTETATTADDGTYVLDVPPATPFRLEFAGNAGREIRWFPNATDPNAAQNLTVAQNQVLTGRDMVLPTLATFGGAITNSDGTAYTGGGVVELWKKVDYTEQGEDGGPAHSTWELAKSRGRAGADLSTKLSDTGAFSFTLTSGSYRLKLVDDPATTSVREGEGFMPGLVGLDDAPNIAIGQEQALGLQKFALPTTAEIRGRVTDKLGAPASGADVVAFYRYVVDVNDGAPVLSTPVTGPIADAAVDGSYVLEVPSRTYRVGVDGATDSFYKTRTQSVTTFNDASDVTVAGVDVDGIDIRLTNGEPINLQKPFITGIAAEGETLTANPGTWSGSGLTFSYQWFSSPTANGAFTAIDGATGTTYAIPGRALPLPGFPGFTPARYRVMVTASTSAAPPVTSSADSLPTGLSVESDPLQGADTTTENRQVPQVTGSAVVGETLTGTDGVWSEGGTFTYRWLADSVVVPGATGKTLAVTPELLGKALRLEVTETTNDPDRVAVSEETAPVSRGVLRNTARPTISGTPTVGNTLTALPGTWNDPSPTFAYQWMANGQPISGATTNTLVLTEALAGSSIRVTVTATKPSGYTPGTASSESTAPVADDPTKVTNRSLPVVSGTPKVGETLSTTNGTWTNEPTSFTYQWLADGVVVTGATQQTFLLTAAQAGKRMSVRVTAAKTGLTSGQATSAQTVAVAPADGTDPETCEITVTDGPTVSGTPAVGNVLAVLDGTTSPEGVSASYQWLRGGLPIPGATGATYRVVTADAGSALAVRVTYSKTDCADVVRTVQAGTVPRDEPTDPVKPRIDTVKKIKGNKFVLRVTVTASTQDPVQGALVLKEGSKRLAGGMLNGAGKRKLVVRGLKKGFHSLRLTYQGNDLVREGSKTFTFTIR